MSNNHDHHNKNGNKPHHEHHILSTPMALKVWGVLICLTFITVAVAQIDLGAANFAVAMIVATIKATIVCMFFMGLKYDHKENAVIFTTSVIFLSIFMILTFGDLLTRGNVYTDVNHSSVPDSFTSGAVVKSKFTKPWIATPEMVAHGKEQFQTQCVMCHGPEGKGNGVASAGLNPKPRNFTSADNWKQGRKPSQIFFTVSHGLGGMPSFASSPSDDRWSLVHYVRTLGPHASETDTPADLQKIGIDPTKEDGGGGGEKVIPVDLAIDQMTSGAPDAEAAKPAKGKK